MVVHYAREKKYCIPLAFISTSSMVPREGQESWKWNDKIKYDLFFIVILSMLIMSKKKIFINLKHYKKTWDYHLLRHFDRCQYHFCNNTNGVFDDPILKLGIELPKHTFNFSSKIVPHQPKRFEEVIAQSSLSHTNKYVGYIYIYISLNFEEVIT